MALPTRTHGRAAFIFIFITVALDMLALGISIPVLPKLVIQLNAGDLAAATSINGLFGFAFACMHFLFSPLVGVLSDRFGRRPLVLLSNLGLGADYVLMALAPSLSWLFAGRLISGITAASFSLGSAYVADITPAGERARKFGMLAAAFGLGFVIGPGVGGVLGSIDLRLPFWVAAGLSLANFAYGLFVLPESLPRERRSRFEVTKANPVGALRLLGARPELRGPAAGTFLYYLAHVALPATFVLYADFRYKWSERTTGLVLAAVGVASTVVGATLVGPLVRRMGDRRGLLLGLGVSAAGFFVYALAPSTALFLVGIPLTAMLGLVGPTTQSLLSRQMGPSGQGSLQGALGSLRGVTEMVGPVLFSEPLAWAIRTGAPAPLEGAPYLLAGAMLVVGMAIFWPAPEETSSPA